MNDEIIDAELVTDHSDDLRKKIDDKIVLGNNQLSICKSDIDDAKNDNREATELQRTSDLLETLSPALDEYNKKYGTSFKLTDFKDALVFSVVASKKEKEIKELIDSEFISNICSNTIVKGILALCFVINSQLIAIQTPEYTQSLTPQSLTTINMIFDWLDKLSKLKEQYEVSDAEKRLTKLTKESETEEDNSRVNDIFKTLISIANNKSAS